MKFVKKKVVKDDVDTTRKLYLGYELINDLVKDYGYAPWTKEAKEYRKNLETNPLTILPIQCQNALDKFMDHDWGKATARVRQFNEDHLEAEKGNLTGVYPNGTLGSTHDIIVFYSQRNDCIYILSRADFEQNEAAWRIGEEEYFDRYKKMQYAENPEYDPDEDHTSPYSEPEFIEKELFKENDRYHNGRLEFRLHGLQFKPEQTEELRSEIDVDSPLPGLYKELEEVKSKYDLNKIRVLKQKEKRQEGKLKNPEEFAYLQNYRKETEPLEEKIAKEEEIYEEHKALLHTYKVVNKQEIQNAYNAIENGVDQSGKKIDFKKYTDPKKVLMNAASQYDVSYDAIIEKIAEFVNVDNKPYPVAIDRVLYNLKQGDQKFYIPDSKEVKDMDSKAFNKTLLNRLKEEVSSKKKERELLNNVDKDELSEADRKYLEEAIEEFDTDLKAMEEKIKAFEEKFCKDSKQKVAKDSKKKVVDVKPAWLDDETIDDIVYDKAWPVEVKEVAKELVKLGVKDSKSAVKYVKDYIQRNPSERKHFKDSDVKKIKDGTPELAERFKEAVDKDTFAVVYQIKDKDGKELIGSEDIAFSAKDKDDLIKKCKEYANGRTKDFQFYVKYFNDGKDVKDADFMNATRDGYEIVVMFENNYGRKFIIGAEGFNTPEYGDFFIGAGYHIDDGTWDQGYYNFKTVKEAEDFLYDNYGDEDLKEVYRK